MIDERVERAFSEHPDFEQTAENEFEAPQKPFDNAVFVIDAQSDDSDDAASSDSDTAPTDGSDTSDAREYRVIVRTPTLDSVVEGEEVAEVVHSGWFETLELRLEDAHTVTGTDSTTPPSIEREGDEVVVTVEFTSEDPQRAVEDALAIVEFVEGTWVQGIIPGYDYREPAASLRDGAIQNYDEGGPGGAGGTGGAGGASGPGGANGSSGADGASEPDGSDEGDDASR